MDKDTDITEGAQAFARTLAGPAGRISFDAAVAQHLGWLTVALARGLSWNHIIELLRRAGVTRDDGRPLARGHLSSVHARQRRKAGNDGIAIDTVRPLATTIKTAPPTRKIPHPAHSGAAPRSRENPPIPAQASTPPGTISTPASSAIRTFMSRAAQQRKNSYDRD